MRKCPCCFTLFESDKPTKKYCSLYCQERKYQALPNLRVACLAANCDNMIWRRQGRILPKYCSHGCNIKHLNDGRPRVNLPKKKCERCPRWYTPARFDSRWCSEECGQANQRKERRDRLFPVLTKTCKCGVEFKTRSTRKVWCKMTCAVREELFRENDRELLALARVAIQRGIVAAPEVSKRKNESLYSQEMRAIGKAVKERLL